VAGTDGPAGLTISGGEPFDQPEGLLALLKALADWRASAGLDFDIFCYSGYPLKRLKANFAPQLELIDLLCPEPYVDALPESKVWRGSTNQPLVPLTQRGERIAVQGAAVAEAEKRFQVGVTDGKVWFIGIPARGDMARVEHVAASRGLLLGGVSWRS
jgi:anaerobic ribonucleoside-triphosphate reductase activating protein